MKREIQWKQTIQKLSASRSIWKHSGIGWVLIIGGCLFTGSGCSPAKPIPATIAEKAESAVEASKSEDVTQNTLQESELNSSLPVDEVAELLPEPKHQPIPEGNWTIQRLIALTSKGPVVIDLMLRVGGVEMAAANSAAIQPIGEDLLKQLGEDPKWDRLLELPLIKSGWLGNLIAEGDQVTQLVGMYDKNKDLLVQSDELAEFMTRGLSRSQPLSIADVGNEPNPDGKSSTFGPLDLNDDNVLSVDEIKSGPDTLAKLDYNSDASVSISELSATPSNSIMADNRMGRSMLQATSLIFHQPTIAADEKSARNLLKRKVTDLMEYYSFLGSIERDQWGGWSDQQWATMDKNNDGVMDKSELLAIFEVDTAMRIAIDLPSPYQEGGKTDWYFQDLDENSSWSSENSSAQVHNQKVDILVSVEDTFSGKLKSLLKSRLNEAYKNAQLKQFLTQQLQLKENALEVVDKDGDQAISDLENDSAWQWLVARQTARIQGRWMIAARPWFQLLDIDRSQTISEFEANKLSDVMGRLDGNKDELVDLNELPMVVRMQLSRQDQRVELRAGQFGESSTEPVEDSNWFSAMDTNRDGSIAKQEFLGGNSDFQDLDRDGDGFISKEEVY